MRQDDRAPFDRALHRARTSAYPAGEFVGQESFMTAGEIAALADAFAADAEAITAQIGRRALDDLLAAHRLWIEWLDAGRVRKLALVAERPAT